MLYNIYIYILFYHHLLYKVTNFENEMNRFKEVFGKHYLNATKQFDTAIRDIDKAIKTLQDIKDALTGAENHLRLANNRAEDLSIKKLTKNNPTMQAKFAALNVPEEDHITEE